MIERRKHGRYHVTSDGLVPMEDLRMSDPVRTIDQAYADYCNTCQLKGVSPAPLPQLLYHGDDRPVHHIDKIAARMRNEAYR